MTGFGEIDQNIHFWAKIGYFWQFLPRNGENRIFLGKSENVTSVSLLCRNFVQETRTSQQCWGLSRRIWVTKTKKSDKVEIWPPIKVGVANRRMKGAQESKK